jgi:hypothetical protein
LNLNSLNSQAGYDGEGAEPVSALTMFLFPGIHR